MVQAVKIQAAVPWTSAHGMAVQPTLYQMKVIISSSSQGNRNGMEGVFMQWVGGMSMRVLVVDMDKL